MAYFCILLTNQILNGKLIMDNQIVEKLIRHLNESVPFKFEKDVMYFLVEVRKIIDLEDLQIKYSVLYFYCNWIVHPVIDKDSNIRRILPILESIEKANRFAGISRLYSMDNLRTELSKFLYQKSLCDFTQDSEKWRSFIIELRNILIEQPIIISDKVKTTVSLIKYCGEFGPDFIPLEIEYKEDTNGIKRGTTFNKDI